MVRAWIARLVAQRAYSALGRGDASVALGAFAEDARFRFAGNHSWSADTSDAATRGEWFQRFAGLSPRVAVQDLLVAGPPWRMRMCVVFDDEIRDAGGAVVYRNHGVQYVQIRWGRITLDEINLDTQKVAEFDRLSLG
jgi:ketosteroid isomerase-like protein